MRPIKKGATDQSVVIRIVDSADGTPETGVVFDTSGIDLWYRREAGLKVSITEATLSALDDAHSDGGFLHIGDGYYRLDLPDAAFATGSNGVAVGGTVTGMVVIGCYVHLVDYDPQDTVRLGLTSLPNAAAEAAGGLYTRGIGAGQINQAANGQADANAVALSGDSAAADNLEKEYDGTGYGQVLQRTTIATLASQVSFTLTAGSADDDAYNGCVVVIEDVSTAAQKAVGVISDYTGSTKTVTLLTDPGVFTIAATDIVTIIADRSLKSTVDNRRVIVAAAGGVEVGTIVAATLTSIADEILTRDWTAVTGEAARSVLQALRFLRNKWSISGGTLTVTEEDDTTEAWTGAVTTTAGDPASAIDPS